MSFTSLSILQNKLLPPYWNTSPAINHSASFLSVAWAAGENKVLSFMIALMYFLACDLATAWAGEEGRQVCWAVRAMLFVFAYIAAPQWSCPLWSRYQYILHLPTVAVARLLPGRCYHIPVGCCNIQCIDSHTLDVTTSHPIGCYHAFIYVYCCMWLYCFFFKWYLH